MDVVDRALLMAGDQEAVTGEIDKRWRWARVGTVVAIDNRPAIEAHDPVDGIPIPPYQSLIVSIDVLRQVVA